MKINKLISFFIVVCMCLMNITFVKAEESAYGTVLERYSENDIKTAADTLFKDLDPKCKTTEQVLSLYNNGNYKDALVLFRNYMIDRIRATPMSVLSNLGAYAQASWGDTIDVICGKMTLEQYNSKYNPSSPLVDSVGYLDYIDVNSDSGINWAAESIDGKTPLPIPSFQGFGGRIAYKYAVSGDEIYIKKYFQILYDYSQNYRNQIEAPMQGMTDDEKIKYAQETDGRVYIRLGGRYAAANLSFVQKAADLTGSLGVICKSLPSLERTGKDFSYLCSAEAVFTDKLSDEAYNLIDPVRFAGLCNHLMRNEAVRVKGYITTAGITNQRMEGLIAAFRYSAMFRDFKVSWQEEDGLCEAINKIIKTSYHKDGGILEKSFNYNVGDGDARKYLRAYGESMSPEMTKDLNDFSYLSDYWDKLIEGYKSNLGILPSVGNQSNRGTKNIWSNSAQYNEMVKNTESNRELEYTSVYFPYSGYAAMRNNWNVDGLYMGTYNNPNCYSGHSSAAVNAILNLSAYGRTMLLSGGAPWYGRNYCSSYTDFLESGYNEINGYFSEASGRKNSTLMVNNKSQAHENLISVLEDEQPLENRWLSDEIFDFSEGKWTGRYTPFNTEKELTNGVYSDSDIERSADHTRQITFLKNLGLWVVLDKTDNKNARINEYTQVWNFAQYQELSNYADGQGGYTNEQIIIGENNLIKTQDNNGPNLFIMNFSNEQLSYEKKYGEFIAGQTAWGWSTGGGSKYSKTGGFAPSADVLVKWKDSGAGSSAVATVLAPSRTVENPVISSENLSTDKITGFKIVTDKGMVEYYNSDETCTYSINGININAQSVLAEYCGNKIHGVVLGCTSFDGSDAEYNDFEFSAGEITKIKEITIPSRFEWVKTKTNKAIPVYNDDEYYSESLKNADISNLESDFDNLNENNFDNFIKQYWHYFKVDLEKYGEIKYPQYIYREIADEMTIENFSEKVNNSIDGMTVSIIHSQDKAVTLKTNESILTWSPTAETYYNSTYSIFEIPMGEAVKSGTVSVTKPSANTNDRTLNISAYISGEYPETVPYNSKADGNLFRKWNEYVNENENIMPNNIVFKFKSGIADNTLTKNLSFGMIKAINKNSNILLKLKGGDNVSIDVGEKSDRRPSLTLVYDRSIILKMLEEHSGGKTNEITVYENYNHYTDNNNMTGNVVINSKMMKVRTLNDRITYLNFSIPQIDSSKLIKAEFKITPSKVALNQPIIPFYAVHIPYIEWRNQFGGAIETTKEYETVSKAIKNKEKEMISELNVSEISKGITESMDITSYVKEQINKGVKNIDIFGSQYSQDTEFYTAYSNETDDSKKPQIVLTVDTSAKDIELYSLKADTLKQFVNTYAEDFEIPAETVRLINEYNNEVIGEIFKNMGKSFENNFVTKLEEAIDNVSTRNINIISDSNLVIDNNQGNGNSFVNSSAEVNYFGSAFSRAAVFGFALPDIDADRIKTVKIKTHSQMRNASSQGFIIGFGNLNPDLFVAEQNNYDNWRAMADIISAERNDILKTNIDMPQNEKMLCEFDVTEYVKECTKTGFEKSYFSVGAAYNEGGTILAVSTDFRDEYKPQMIIEFIPNDIEINRAEYSLWGKELYISTVNITKNREISNAKMLVAVKDKINGKLIGNTSKDITNELNDAEMLESVNINISSKFETASPTELNVFVWDSIKNLKAISNKYRLNVIMPKNAAEIKKNL